MEAVRTDPRKYRVPFIAVAFVVALFVASPALQRLLFYPRAEFFSELWLLGPNRKAEGYPYNITLNQENRIYLGIGNQLGHCAYYLVEVKFRNSTQSAPSTFGPMADRTPSTLSSLYNITAVVADQASWEKPLVFSFDYVYNDASKAIRFRSMTLNSIALDLSSSMVSWNSSKKEFLGNLIFELWIYDTTSSVFQYHSRSVDLKLNMTTV